MNIEQIRNLPPATILQVVESKGTSTAGLPPEMVQYILQLNRASELMRSDETDGSQLACARLLQKEFPQISLRTARRRMADAITYLFSDEDNTPEQWHAFYADKMDRLGHAAEQNQDLSTAMKCYAEAHEMRVQAAAGRVDPERVRYKRILVSPDVQSGRMGLDDTGMRDLMQQAYQIIDKSNIPQREKERLRRETAMETGIEDAAFEEIS